MSLKPNIRLLFVLLPLAFVHAQCTPTEQFHRWDRGGGGLQTGSGGDVTGGGGAAGAGGIATGSGGKGGTAGIATGSGGKGSGGIVTGSGGKVPTCNDLIKNQDETDVDCGGATCTTRCAVGKLCQGPSDCVTASPALACTGTPLKCTNPCTDKTQDGDETGVDCGGSCPLKCIGDSCSGNTDCQSNNCDTATSTCAASTHPLASIDETCWATLTGFNGTVLNNAKTVIAPCMVQNGCCAPRTTTCTESCFTTNDGACGSNTLKLDQAPYQVITQYYTKCVK